MLIQLNNTPEHPTKTQPKTTDIPAYLSSA